jgi:hypothetical protein
MHILPVAGMRKMMKIVGRRARNEAGLFLGDADSCDGTSNAPESLILPAALPREATGMPEPSRHAGFREYHG